MAIVINMPRLGLNEDENENVLGEWFVSEGDYVKKDDALFSIETDKSSMTVYAEEDGMVLKTYYEEYDLVPVMEPMCIIGKPGEDISSLLLELEALGKTQKSVMKNQGRMELSNSAQHNNLPFADLAGEGSSRKKTAISISPRARKLALANGVSVQGIVPTGAEGRIVEADIIKTLKLHAGMSALETTQESGREADGAATGFSAETASENEAKNAKGITKEITKALTDKDRQPVHIPLTPVRKAIARNMYNSLKNMAQTSDSVEVDVTDLVSMRKRLAEKQEQLGVKITINDFLSYAAVKMIKTHPLANASFAGSEIITYPYVNLGMAVATSYGLISPVVRDADRMTLVELSAALHGIITKARNRELTPEDQRNGTFTITNMGIFPVDNFNPILPEPTSCILGFGRCMEKPAVYNGEICIRSRMVLSVTYDHRVFDGGEVGSIMRTMKEYLEMPELFLVQ